MIKPATFLKATATTLTACILAACGGDSSSSNNDVKEAPKTTQTHKTETHAFTVSLPTAGAKEGKSVFKLNVKDLSGTAAASVVPNMKPMMAMDAARGGHHHSTPYTGCTETDAAGDSECTVYFLMPSKMANGTVMGKWNLMFSLPDTEGSIDYSPDVSMNMMAKAQLKGGAGDKIPKMTMMENRTYYIFNNGITKTVDTSSVELFLAAKESMMSFPTLTDNVVLNKDTDNALTIDSQSIILKVSSDKETWVDATSLDAAKGTWKAEGINNLMKTLFIKLSVNGTEKTTDGEVAAVVDGVDNSITQISLSMDSM